MQDNQIVELDHGAGGKKMDEFIKFISQNLECQSSYGGGVGVHDLDDGASLPIERKGELVVSTDSHTVSPIFFPGGCLGSLAACGTINDIVVMGAIPIALTSALVVEEGYLFSDLACIISALAEVCSQNDIAIVAGDSKVMPRGSLDGVVMTTTGIGLVPDGNSLIKDTGAKPGDKVIITGSVGDHGAALLATREGISLRTDLVSDVSSLLPTLKESILGGGIHAMKDPTRGGIAAALNEIAGKSKVSIWLEEDLIPVKDQVRSVCEVFGIDPFHVTCEGRAVVVISSEKSGKALQSIKKTENGRDARIVGEIREERPGYVIIKTGVGGHRIVEKPLGEPIPRVC